MKLHLQDCRLVDNQSPSLRGSGLKLSGHTLRAQRPWSPSLRGSGLKLLAPVWMQAGTLVSLFTREWIEICKNIELCEQ